MGFDFASYLGSEVKDEIEYKKGNIYFLDNNNGGINGGISNGNTIVFRCVVKPTPSIGQSQKTINIKDEKNVSLNIKGAHDPAIISRCSVIIESMSAIALLNMYVKRYGYEWTR